MRSASEKRTTTISDVPLSRVGSLPEKGKSKGKRVTVGSFVLYELSGMLLGSVLHCTRSRSNTLYSY
uniref:Uncharacterized protein n=1 Tax=Aegilops tauschii subsp. strangulata TaxID=200361 RepID=A0A453FMG8_AEGTS